MPLEIHRANERGSSELGWLSSRFSFSFADYYNPDRMGFGALRVLNDDIISPKSGFDMHPHSNFEIVSIVLAGAIEHRDSMGNHGLTEAGEIQRMSAGTGVLHSEHNPSATEETRMLQIWVAPKEKGIAPSYEQKKFSGADMKNTLLEVVSGKKGAGKIYIHQDSSFFLGTLGSGKRASIKIGAGKGAYVFIISGSASVNGGILAARDAAAITGEQKIEVMADENAQVLAIVVPVK